MTPTANLRSSAVSRRGGALTVIIVLVALAAAAWQSGILKAIFEGETEVKIEGEDLLIMKESDILGIIDTGAKAAKAA